MEVDNDFEHAPRVHTIDLSVKIPSESQDTINESNKIFMLTQKVELMSGELASFKREVNNKLASLKVDVRTNMASLAQSVG